MKNNQSANNNLKYTSHTFQLILMTITSCIIAFLVYRQTSTFNSTDPRRVINPIVSTTLSKESLFSINVGLYIQNFIEFNIVNNEFIFNGIIFFEFMPGVISLEDVGKFEFVRGEIVQKSKPTTYFEGDKLVARYNIRVKFSSDLNYKLFPFSSHRINLIMVNHDISPDQIKFKSDVATFNIDKSIYISGWHEYNRYVAAGYSLAELEKFSKAKVANPIIVFTIEYLQSGIKNLLSILLPLIFLFFIAIFSFALDPDKYSSSLSSISVGCATGLLAYKFVIDKFSPNVNYFMISDVLFFLFLGLVCTILIINLRTVSISGKSKRNISIMMHLIVIFTFIYLFNFWH